MPDANKTWVLGDGVESNRPATNFPGVSVDSNRLDRLVEKSGLGVKLRRLQARSNQSDWVYLRRSAVASALRSGPRGLY